MKRLLLPLIACMGLGCDGSLDKDDIFSGIYFVKLNAQPAEVVSIASEIASEFDLQILHVYDSASEGFSIRVPHLLVPELEKLEFIDEIIADPSQDYVVPSPTDSPYDYGENEVPKGIVRIGGPYDGLVGLEDIHVAILDTGIQGNHPELNVVAEIDLVGESTGSYANGSDPNGHGTHIAGTIGAAADEIGVAGVAPGVPLHAVRVLDSDGSGYYSDIIAGIEYVLEHPEIRVVNMSLGGPRGLETRPMREAIQRLVDAGVVVCIAAGNETMDTGDTAPAGFDLGLVVSAYEVGGTGNTIEDMGFAWFSNYGGEVDIAAPGVSIYSTWPDGGYSFLDGTSMATPHVTGAVALLLAENPDMTEAEVVDAVIGSGENGFTGQTGSAGDHPEPLLDMEALLEW